MTVLGDGIGAVGLPLTSTPSVIGRCLGFMRHCVGTVNIGSCVPTCPFYMTLRERGSTATRTAGTPDQDAR
jgi:hypothetical protein